MEKPKNYLNRLFLLLILTFAASETKAESPYRRSFYTSFINREMYRWGGLINTVEASNPPATIDQKLELINFYYGYIGHMMGKKEHEIAGDYLERAEKLNNQVLRLSPRNATAYAYKGAFMGMRIGLNRLKSVYLGPESKMYINKAIALEPNNVQAIIDKGNLLFYSPGMLGGDKDDAITLFLHAEKLMEKNKDTDHNWNYLILLTTLAKAYEKLDQLPAAKLAYEKALRNEPNYKWVRDDLYPKLILRMKK